MSTNRGGVTPPNIRETEKRPSLARPLKNSEKTKSPVPEQKGKRTIAASNLGVPTVCGKVAMVAMVFS